MYLSSWYSTVRASYLCSTAPIRHSRAPSCSLDERSLLLARRDIARRRHPSAVVPPPCSLNELMLGGGAFATTRTGAAPPNARARM